MRSPSSWALVTWKWNSASCSTVGRPTAVARDQDDGGAEFRPIGQRVVEGTQTQSNRDRIPDHQRSEYEHQVAFGQREVVDESELRNRDGRESVQPTAAIESIAADHRSQEEVEPGVEHLTCRGVGLRMRGERSEALQRTTEGFGPIGLQGLGVEPVRSSPLPRGRRARRRATTHSCSRDSQGTSARWRATRRSSVY